MKKILLIAFLALAAGGIFLTYKQLDTQQIQAANQNQPTSEHLSPVEFQKAIQSGSYTLIDVRTVEEYNAGHIKDAIQKDFRLTEVFKQYVQTLDKKKKYLLYCRTDHRSGDALAMMKQLGFTNIADLDGGITAWAAANLPVEK